MAIKYQGVTVGEVTSSWIPNFNKGGIEITARVLPEWWLRKIAVANSHFWLAEPEIHRLNGIKNGHTTL